MIRIVIQIRDIQIRATLVELCEGRGLHRGQWKQAWNVDLHSSVQLMVGMEGCCGERMWSRAQGGDDGCAGCRGGGLSRLCRLLTMLQGNMNILSICCRVS